MKLQKKVVLCLALLCYLRLYAKELGISTTLVPYNLYKLCSFNFLSRTALSLAVVYTAFPESWDLSSPASHSAHKPQLRIFMTQTSVAIYGRLLKED